MLSPHPQGVSRPENPLLACHACDQLHRLDALTQPGRRRCVRCGTTLFRHLPRGLERALALDFTLLLLLILVNLFPLLSLELAGRVSEVSLLSAAWALVTAGFWPLGLLVFLTSLLFPLLIVLGWLYLLLPVTSGRRAPGSGWVLRWVNRMAPWSMVAVFVLAVLVAMVKLLKLATVIPGVALYALFALLVISALAYFAHSPGLIWPLVGRRVALAGEPSTQSREPALPVSPSHPSRMQALAQGLHHCHHCRLLVPRGRHSCPRCGAAVHARKPHSCSRTLALLLAAAVLFVPANLYPVMTVSRFGSGEPSTIIGGVFQLIEAQMWPLALLVLFASIVVPLLKMAVLGFLVLGVRRGSRWRPRDRTWLYHVTEVVGAWSMVDVYLVAILSALVQLDALANIQPGLGASYFAAVVVLTLLAAHTFDPRLIWDNHRDR